jgi:hypothetical protein
MKPNTTLIMVLKGVGLVGGSMASSFAGSLSQWANEATGPSRLQCVIIAVTTLGAGLSALVAFISTSFGDWSNAT